MTPPSKHLLNFEGGNALSDFRAKALLPKLQQACSRIASVHARHVHWVWSDAALGRQDVDRLEALLRYGDTVPRRGATTISAPSAGPV